ncbi:MAG: DUF3181 family protein, partial [Leptolyngbyaceae cyanobacterium]
MQSLFLRSPAMTHRLNPSCPQGANPMAKSTSADVEALAAEIGENIYIDIAKWHLYLSDAHL